MSNDGSEDEDDAFVVRISHCEGQLFQVQFDENAYDIVPKEFKTQGGFDASDMTYKFDVSRSSEVEKVLNGFTIVRADPYDIVPHVIPPDASPYEEAVEAVMQGHNVFITGEAGTGKSRLLYNICNQLDGHVVLCATTGPAAKSLAANIGTIEGIKTPVTVHLAIGLTPDDIARLTIDEILAKVKKNREYSKAKPIDTLIIDEVSMLSAYMFELVVRVCKVLGPRVQLIVVGDFAQLPPVCPDDDAPEAMRMFAFESPIWDPTFGDNVFLLNHNYRILNADCDPEAKAYLEMLSRIRLGAPLGDDIERLMSMSSHMRPITDEHMRLFPKNLGVDEVNREKLRDLGTPIHKYPAVISAFSKSMAPPPPSRRGATTTTTTTNEDEGFVSIEEPDEELPYSFWKRVDAVHKRKDEVRLAEGARVMLNRNRDIERGLVNGSLGTVVSVATGAVVVRFDGIEGDVLIKMDSERGETLWHREGGKSYKAVIRELPLQLAWASSIHKSQGHNLMKVSVDFGVHGDLFAPGQAYVALSRVRHPDGMICDHGNAIETGVLVDDRVVTYYTKTVPSLEVVRRERVAAMGTVSTNPATMLGVPFRRRDVKRLLPHELGRTPLLMLHRQYNAYINNQTNQLKRRRLGIPEPTVVAAE